MTEIEAFRPVTVTAAPAARSCVWPECLTPAQHTELQAQVTAEEKGQHRPAMPDQRPICGCDESTATTPAPVDPALAQRIARVIWERQNPGRSYADCEPPWNADAEADAEVVLAELAPELTRAHRAEQAEAKVTALEAEREGWAEALNNLLAIDKPLAAIAAARALHQPVNVVPAAEHGEPADCTNCGPGTWPCDTIRALTGPAEENTP